jgi:hypothetical protein
VTAELANNINGNPTERLVIAGPFGTAPSHREPPDLPWLEEAEGTENTETRQKFFFLKTGVAISPTERAEVQAEEAAAGVPTERRTGCYHNPPLTEIVRAPGYTSARETELALRQGPKGCVNLNFIAPAAGVEIPCTGTLEPEMVNGTHNGLLASNTNFKGGFIGGVGTEVREKSSERNERQLECGNGYGPGYLRSIEPVKRFGYLKEELLTLK